MRHRSLIPIALLAALASAQAAAAQAPPQAHLHFDSAALAALQSKASQVNDVTLDGAVLKLGLSFMNSANSDLTPEQLDALAKLEGVYVKELDFKKGSAPALSDAVLAPVRAQLKAPCWSRIVSSQSSGAETDEVYACTDPSGTIHGLAVLSRQPDELDLVNIVGSIDPAELSKLGGQLGIPSIHISHGKSSAK